MGMNDQTAKNLEEQIGLQTHKDRSGTSLAHCLVWLFVNDAKTKTEFSYSKTNE